MRTTMLVMVLVAVTASSLAAQGQQIPRSGGGTRGQGVQGAERTPPTPQERALLEQRVRENFAAEVKKRLGLTDDQMTKLTTVNQRLDAQRRQLFQQEREARVALRTELAAGDDKVNQARVAELLDTVLRLQRSRLELVEREQRELAAFLTPVQRARYQAFVDFVQRRMDDMDGRRDGREGRGGGGPRGGGPPGAPGKRPPGTPATPPPSR
jgi:hypothetical protein